MKKIFTSALVLVLAIGAAQAQTTSTNKPAHHKGEQRLGYNKLNLTEEQKSRLQSVKSEYKKQLAELQKQDQITVAEMRNRKKAINSQFKSQSESILTPAQKEQLATIKKDYKANYKAGAQRMKRERQMLERNKGAANRGFRGQEFQKELGLTAEQQQKVTDIRAGYKTKFEALRNDNSLAAEQKRERMQELRKQQGEQIKAVLTAEQVEKVKSLRQQRSQENTK